jgi:hypothetical protein
MWSHTDPVTVFGAALSPIGWAEVGPMFEKLASRFSNCRSLSGVRVSRVLGMGEPFRSWVGSDRVHGLGLRPCTRFGIRPSRKPLSNTLVAARSRVSGCWHRSKRRRR